ncbi:Oidioi.mRNA.OKI2018_I69.chr2.g4746.t1.cds [Oikopleura dioica]|uniref:Oidioi.mRNA.OKI2018_I69.chr2.g4746.t1.cds n=1 Tax=Oikopleura dioica TaxID=34765 RepID=A0ABN7T4T3_OIKDI|nr:Oidioi.mRNA.OKI2018_I69.chr2.g4746.t1.cds [Oikopleura dioica]
MKWLGFINTLKGMKSETNVGYEKILSEVRSNLTFSSNPKMGWTEEELELYPYLNNYTVPEYFNQYGITDENLIKMILFTKNSQFLIVILCFVHYIVTWWVRRGQEPAMNSISSTMITNDRVFIIMRITLAMWSLTMILFGWEGIRSIIFGAYFPFAAILSLYVNFQRSRIVEGFGTWTQALNKVNSFLFNVQAPLRLLVSLTWWTRWIGFLRYRDMARSLDIHPFWLWSKEYTPTLFLLVELLWFDTKVPFDGFVHVTVIGSASLVALVQNTNKPPPQGLNAMDRDPAACVVCAVIFTIGLIVIHLGLAFFSHGKIWTFKKVPVIGQRLTNRQACTEIFQKRHALNKFMPPSMLEQRKTTIRKSYANFGKASVVRASIARKSAAVRKS